MNDKPDYYRMFCNGLLGMIDDAETCGYDSDGLKHLREASEYFESHWRMGQKAREQDVARHKTD